MVSQKKSGSERIKSKSSDLMLIALLITAVLVGFNQVQIRNLSSSIDGITGSYGVSSFSSSGADLSEVDTSQLSSTAMSVATVFPELKDAKDENDVISIMLASGTPEYSEALGGITFDDPVSSLNYLSKWQTVVMEDVKKNNPDAWQRYLNLAAAPRGISCEHCCGVGPQGAGADGRSKCGCQHNPALLAITLGLLKSTDYSDAEVLREVMKWKTTFFPKKMIALGVQVSGQDASQVKSLPGMVGGC